MLTCENKKCPAKIKEEILYFIQKIGIDDLSMKRLEEMINKDLIVGIKDLYLLKEDDFYKLDKVKEKLAKKLHSNIQNSMKVKLIDFMTALGIPGGGKNKCERVILAGYNTLDSWLKLNEEKLIEIEGFAQKSASDFIIGLKAKKELIEDLIKVGFDIQNAEGLRSENLKGKKFCITGTLSMKRSDIEKIIKSNGGSVVGSVSKNTHYLVTNDTNSSSSKFKKAKDLNIPILNETKLLELTKE